MTNTPPANAGTSWSHHSFVFVLGRRGRCASGVVDVGARLFPLTSPDSIFAMNVSKLRLLAHAGQGGRIRGRTALAFDSFPLSGALMGLCPAICP